MENIFPAPPVAVPADVTAPTAAFRREVRRVVGGLVFFALVYLVLVAAAAVFTALCVYLGIALMAFNISFYTILIGLGLIFMGFMVFFFLVKFVLASSKDTAGTAVELTEEQEPVLFDFIRRTAAEVGTHFPKKVLLTPEVNASVSYSSAFWSLFFPVRKNLTIGLGLVNSVNVSEFKAVLAHEFGHFSQRSMRLGTYVYYVNRVVYNLLFHNDQWAGAVDRIAGVHAILAFFAQGAVRIVLGVQWILRKLYAVINLRQRRLSRAMEFHADAISASVSGSNNAIAALRRIDLGSTTYQQSIRYAEAAAGNRQKAGNLYHWQQRAGAVLAAEHALAVDQGLPVITESFLTSRIAPRIVYTDPWASHPTQAEREAALTALGLRGEQIDAPAWRLFRQPEHWQRALTARMYEEIDDVDNWTELPVEDLSIDFGNGLPRAFRGYYDRTPAAALDLEALRANGRPQPLADDAFDRLFGDGLPDRLDALEHDIHTLQQIENEEIDARSFDFDGQQYDRAEAPAIRTQLEAEVGTLTSALLQRRHDAAQVFYDAALTHHAADAERLLEAYRTTDAACARMRRVVDYASPVLHAVRRFHATEFFLHTEDTALFRQFVETDEPAWCTVLADMLEQADLPPELQEKARQFLDKAEPYLTQTLNGPVLVTLYEIAMAVYEAVRDEYVAQLKALLQRQLALADTGAALAR